MPMFRVAGLVMLMLVVCIAGSRADSFTPTLSVELADSADGIIIVGTTNLPDGAEVQYTLSPPGRAPIGGGVLNIKNGRVSTPPITVSGSPLAKGDYEFAAGCSDSDMQPAAVKKLFGADGKNLDGPLVQPYGKAFRIVYKTVLTLR